MNLGVPDPSTITVIAVAATFTAEPLEAALCFWMHELEAPAKISFAPYGQVFQQMVDPASLFSNNHHGINVLITRLEDLVPDESRDADPHPREDERTPSWGHGDTLLHQTKGGLSGETDRNVRGFLSALTGALERAPIPHLVCFCPSLTATGFTIEQEDRLAAAVREIPGVEVVTSTELMVTYPVKEVFDLHGDQLAHIPYTAALYTALGTMIARKIYALQNAPYKVIAFDADQTLWNGICGEDGPFGVGIDSPRRAIQEFLVRQHDAGMLLCLCSKNNDADVAAVFDRRPEMVLRRDHIVGWRVNWSPKSANLRSLARDLQLGLESFIFLDDDPVACADVQANCPEVLTLVLPQNPEEIAPFLERIWAFDHHAVTQEAAHRTAFYRKSSQRREFQSESPTLKEFIAGLDLKIQFEPLASHNLARAAELTQRTNQFNVTTLRRTEARLQSLVRPQGSKCLIVQVKDRFGDYGAVGAMIFATGSGALVVDTFLLSCRALGRGVEHRMLAKLGEIALQEGLASVNVTFLPSAKNQPTLDFLDSVGCNWKEDVNEGLLFRFPADLAAAMRYDPPVTEATVDSKDARAGAAATRTQLDARAKAALLSSIAVELSDMKQVTALITAEPRTRPELSVPYVAPASECERQLAGMFSEVLGVEHVGIHDNFFDLGGHSLLAVMLISRMRDAFQVEIPLSVLFEVDFTVAKAARKIAACQGMQSLPEGTTEALEQLLDALPDEEVRALLAEQRTPGPPTIGPGKV